MWRLGVLFLLGTVASGCIHGPSALDQKADRIETKHVDDQRAALKDSE